MVDKEMVFIDLSFSNKEDVLKFLAETVVDKNFSTDKEAVYSALLNRENEGTTGLMDGFAIPHAKSDSIVGFTIVILKLIKGINWDSLDGELTRYIIAMFIPANESEASHVKTLSHTARMLMLSDYKDAFISANTKKELAELFQKNLEE